MAGQQGRLLSLCEGQKLQSFGSKGRSSSFAQSPGPNAGRAVWVSVARLTFDNDESHVGKLFQDDNDVVS